MPDAPSSSPSVAQPAGPAAKILVADDDQSLLRTLTWILKEHGYTVVAVPGGEGLLTKLEEERPQLLLLDIMMPKVDGLQLLERLKSDERYRDLPVLMVSSMPPEEATVKALGLGAADFIAKPFRVRELLARVEAHLRVGQALGQAREEARSRAAMVDILHEATDSLRPAEIYHILARRAAAAVQHASPPGGGVLPAHHGGRSAAHAGGRAVRGVGHQERGGGDREGVRLRIGGLRQAATREAGVDGRADGDDEPPRPAGGARAGARSRAALRARAQHLARRHRPLQGDQRYPWPHCGRFGSAASW